MQWLECGCCCADWADEEKAIRIKRRLLGEEVYWSGVVWFDYLFHICNEHPILGILAAHPLHPFSKSERLVVEFVRCAGTLAWVVIVKNEIREHHIQEYGADDPDSFKDQLELLVYSTIPLALIRFLLMKLSIASGNPDSALGQKLGEDCLLCVQRCVMCFFCLLAALSLFLCKTMLENAPENESARVNFELARTSILQGWTWWFVTDIVMPIAMFKCPWVFGFFCQWREERKEQEEKEHGVFGGRFAKFDSDESSALSASSDQSEEEGGCC